MTMSACICDTFLDLRTYLHVGIDFDYEAKLFFEELNLAKKENDIQKYIKGNKKWYIPGSILRGYDFGHHEAFVAPELQLGAEYKVDYALLGRNSIGYHMVLVEFEDVNVNYSIKSINTESKAVRAGITQIKDWKRWMDNNRHYFMNSYGLGEIAGNIPSWGIYYCLVVGRRSLMTQKDNELRSQLQDELSGLKIISYDRIVDYIPALHNSF